jgi:hypothetical protein
MREMIVCDAINRFVDYLRVGNNGAKESLLRCQIGG